jgi:hypothetical protein
MKTTFPSTISEGIAISATNGKALSKDAIYTGATRDSRVTPRCVRRINGFGLSQSIRKLPPVCLWIVVHHTWISLNTKQNP